VTDVYPDCQTLNCSSERAKQLKKQGQPSPTGFIPTLTTFKLARVASLRRPINGDARDLTPGIMTLFARRSNS
jgi:hypothetical protein